MARKSDKKVGMLFGVIFLLIIVIAGFSFNMTGDSKTNDTDTTSTSTIQCAKDFTKDVSFVTRNSFEKGVSVSNTTYQVWKVLDGVKIPQDNAVSSLTVGYDESYEVVASADGYKNEMTTFSVDAECNGPEDMVFYLTAVPTSIDATFENSKITGPNSASNRVPISAEVTRNVKAIFNGESKTSTDAIIVIDVNKNNFTIDSTLASATQPESHSTPSVNHKSYAYTLGTFDGASDLLANFDIVGDEDLVAGSDINITYTIYQFQNGFVNSDSGEFDNVASMEDNDDNLLLGTFTGNIYVKTE